MAICKRCRHHRPSVGSTGLCLSCERFLEPKPATEEALLALLAKHSTPGRARRSIPALEETATKAAAATEQISTQTTSVGRANEAPSPPHITRNIRANRMPCPRCRGAGIVHGYAHIEGGKCFRCKGKGVIGRPCPVRQFSTEELEAINSQVRERLAAQPLIDANTKSSAPVGGSCETKELSMLDEPIVNLAPTAGPACTSLPSNPAESLAELLEANGHAQLASAVRTRRVPSLQEEHRKIVAAYAKYLFPAAPTILDPERVRSAMALVTASGWGNEPEVTLPGPIQPLMQLD
jgi:hypothetical protein